jgi:4,5-dihydroxyphthalate decarboxylase
VNLSLPGLCIESIPEGATLSGMLEDGDLDAVFTARLPGPFLRESPKVRRMLPDYRRVEAEYFERTRIFPIMHLVVIRRDVYERDPWIAQSLTKAFGEAKRLAAASIYDTTALPTMVPWMHTEIETTRKLMGNDWWPYGLEPNREALETFLRYSHEQGLLARPLDVEELFAAETLETFRV